MRKITKSNKLQETVRADVVCFKDMASFVMYEMKRKSEETKKDIVIAAAIIKAELRELDKSAETYPTLHEIEDIEKNKEWIPECLQLLLNYIVPSTLKQLSIILIIILGQCITQASCQRSVICPIVFGLVVQLEKSFGSKWLLNQLHKFGFSTSSEEVFR